MNRYSEYDGQIKSLNQEITLKNKDLQIKNKEIEKINNRVSNFVHLNTMKYRDLIKE